MEKLTKFKAGDIVKLRVCQNNPRPSSNRYRFVRYSRAGDIVAVGVNSNGTLQYFGTDAVELGR